jgi:hypothetical protein
MKNALFFSFFFFHVMHAQKFSLDVSYKYMYAKQWDRSIQLYNFSRPWLLEKQPLFMHGLNAAFNYARSTKQDLNHGLSVDLSFFRSVAENKNMANTINLYISNLGYFVRKDFRILHSNCYADMRLALTVSGLFRRVNQEPILVDDTQTRAFGIGSDVQVKLGYYLPCLEGISGSLFLAVSYAPYVYSPYSESVLNQTMGITNHYGTGVFGAQIGFRKGFALSR